jgi:hypothetical protein
MDKYSAPAPERESYAKHRREVNRQILLPIILVTLVGVGFATLSGFAAAGNKPAVGLWADISLIWLIIPMMFLALLILILMIALIVGLRRLLEISPYYTGLVQAYALLINVRLTIWTDKIIQPVLTIRSWLDLILKREGKNGR